MVKASKIKPFLWFDGRMQAMLKMVKFDIQKLKEAAK